MHNSHSNPSKNPRKATVTSSVVSRLETSPSHVSNGQERPRVNFSSFLNNLINPSHSSSLQKELKAARQLGMLVGVFTVSWLPYFIIFLVVAWCNHCVSNTVFTASIWLGYLNSTFNPLIYPLCNIHFRRAFQKICRCKHAKTKLPNLTALRELQALHSKRHRR
jgi:bacteriorhodopsin